MGRLSVYLNVFHVMPSFSTTGMRLRARACSSSVIHQRRFEMGSPGQTAYPRKEMGRVMTPS